MNHSFPLTTRVNVASIAKVGLMGGAAVLATGSAHAEVLTFPLNEDLSLGETFVLPGLRNITFSNNNTPSFPAGKLTISTFVGSELAGNDFLLFGPGSVIGPETPFVGFSLIFSASQPVPGSFLGFSFESEPAVKRYGWVEMSIWQVPGQVLIKGFGYETTPGLAITTPVPEPDSLALLAAGSLVVAGAAARRRRRATPAVGS